MTCLNVAEIASLCNEHDCHNGWENTQACVNKNMSQPDCFRQCWFNCNNLVKDVKKCDCDITYFSLICNFKTKIFIIYFPGTSNINDYGYDLDLRKHTETIRGVELNVSCGFWRRYHKADRMLQQNLQDIFECNNLFRNEWTIVLAGYSLGATTALFAAACLPFFCNYGENVIVCLFGFPPCCCCNINILLKHRNILQIHNFANRFDVVTTPWIYAPWTCKRPGAKDCTTLDICAKQFFHGHSLRVYKESLERYIQI